MSTNNGFIRLSGVLFFVSGLCFVGTTVFLGDRILYSWLGLAGTVLLMASMWGIYELVKPVGKLGALKLGVSAMLIGSVFLILLYLIAYFGAVSIMNPVWEDLTAQATPEVNQVANIAVIWFGSVLTYGLGPLFIVIAAWHTTAVPQWLNWLGLISGLLGLLWAGWGWALGPENILILLPGVVLAYLWQLSWGISMIRHKEIAA
jgi:hypothetical protein